MLSYTLATEQSTGYSILYSGVNAFLTGGAGVGKSYLINKYVTDMRAKRKNVLVCAPTGIAAGNVNGTTIHRTFELPLGVILQKDIRNIDKYNKKIDELLYETDILIIDEISMCRVDVFEYVAVTLLKANRRRKMSGRKPIQFIVVGDFYQLMPVVTRYDRTVLIRDDGEEHDAGLAFKSKYWKMFKFRPIILNEVMRQDNKEFIESLNRLRLGDVGKIITIYDKSNKNRTDGITICGLNSDVKEINERELAKIDSKLIYFLADYSGSATENDVTVDSTLYLKIGAKVITLVNDPDGRYYNGSIGIVTKMYRDAIGVCFDGVNTVYIEKFNWDIYDYKLNDADGTITREVCGCVTQFPLKLAYAITMHKSQGQTYECANISPYCWESGQLYVAISRVKSFEGLHFNYEPTGQDVLTSSSVRQFYRELAEDAYDSNSIPVEVEETKAETVVSNQAFADLKKVMNLF